MSYTLRPAGAVAALAAVFCILWSANAPAGVRVAYLTEQYLALVLGLNLCALFLWVRDGLPHASRVSFDWRGHFLLGALYYTLPKPARIDGPTGQSKPAPTVCRR